MTEIRSTLDIIMEKAEGFEVTDQDKEAMIRNEAEEKARGLLRRFLDRTINEERFKAEIDAFDQRRGKIVRCVLERECLDRIDPEGDNTRILQALNYVMAGDTGPIKDLISEFRRNLDKERGVHEKGLIEQLKRRGISGSAVIPNLEANPEWINCMAQKKEGLYKQLHQSL